MWPFRRCKHPRAWQLHLYGRPERRDDPTWTATNRGRLEKGVLWGCPNCREVWFEEVASDH